jgi:hypothetical protein
MTQTSYRILPQSVILYGVEMTEPDKAPRVLLTCSTATAAETWISEIKRLSDAKFGSAGLSTQKAEIRTAARRLVRGLQLFKW